MNKLNIKNEVIKNLLDKLDIDSKLITEQGVESIIEGIIMSFITNINEYNAKIISQEIKRIVQPPKNRIH